MHVVDSVTAVKELVNYGKRKYLTKEYCTVYSNVNILDYHYQEYAFDCTTPVWMNPTIIQKQKVRPVTEKAVELEAT